MVLVYSAENKESVSLLEANISRDAGAATVTVPAGFVGQQVHVYMAFQTAEGTAVSDSVYVGPVSID